MTDAWDGLPLHPERDGDHMMEWIDEHGRVWHEVWKWSAQTAPPVWLRPNFTGGPYGYEPHHLTAPIYNNIRYLGPCLTPAEVAAREAAAFKAGQEDMRERAAYMAAMACLVEPDGGAPSAEETAVADTAARRIRALPIKEANDE